jgi:hypothetical protein
MLGRIMWCGRVRWPACGNSSTHWFRLYCVAIFICTYITVCTVNTRHHPISRSYHHIHVQCRATAQRELRSTSTFQLRNTVSGLLATNTSKYLSTTSLS